LIKSENLQLVKISCDILANISQHNDVFGAHPLATPLLHEVLMFLKLRKEKNTSPHTQCKLLYAANCMVTSSQAVALEIARDPELGLEFVLDYILESRDEDVVKRLTRYGSKLLAVNCKFYLCI
jgi:hypothetical protein